MKINITKKEYLDLLDIFSIADWVLNAHKTEEDPRTEQYRKLEQKIFSFAKEMGFDHLIEYDPKYKQYFPTSEFESTSMDHLFIDEFENDTFWDELITRLSDRDLVQLIGSMEEMLKLDLMERYQKQAPIENMYHKEFEKYGLTNLHIVKKEKKSSTKKNRE